MRPHAHRRETDFTTSSTDGYTFETFWETREIARDVIASHARAKERGSDAAGSTAAGPAAAQAGSACGAAQAAQSKRASGRQNRHFHDSIEHEEVMASFHAT
jgi:hypothetical protein